MEAEDKVKSLWPNYKLGYTRATKINAKRSYLARKSKTLIFINVRIVN